MQVEDAKFIDGLLGTCNEKARKQMGIRLSNIAWELSVYFHIPKDSFYNFLNEEFNKQKEELCK